MRKLLLVLPMVLALASCSIYSKCLKPEVGKITWTGTAQELGEVVESMLLCDPAFSAADVPPCAVQALDDFANSLGPDGKTVENCVLLVLEGNSSAQVSARARSMEVKRGIHAASLQCHGRYAVKSPGDSTPKTGPTASLGDLSSPAYPVFESLASCPSGSIYGVVDGRPACLGEGPAGGVYLVGYVQPRWTPYISAAALETISVAEGGNTSRAGAVAISLRESVPTPSRAGVALGDSSASPAKPAFAYPGPNVGAVLEQCYRDCGDNAHGAIAPPGGCECWRKVGSTWRWVAAADGRVVR